MLWTRVLKKSRVLLGSDTVAERYELIHAEKGNNSITMMTNLLRVARSSHYELVNRIGVITATKARRARLGEQVKAAFEEFCQVYGWRRIAFVLNERGIDCSVGLVADIMREHDLVAV